MAALNGLPLVLHEQNSVPGLANRVLALLAKRVLTGFPDVLKQGEWCGNPVRPEITRLPPPAERLAGRSGPLRLLVLGGSLGAQALNQTLPAGLAVIAAKERPDVWHQSGEKHIEALRAAYASAGVEAHLVPFIADMAEAYAWADLVICRAGALTVAELAAAGVASILVPFPHAVDDHQTANARFLAQAGAAIVLPQDELAPEMIALLHNYSRPQLQEMAERARDLAKPEATVMVARVCADVAKKSDRQDAA
jgi:UDP-N-acetylglucosamine--N-acetylmuramyl-(pentapeptide) pyrophosphoryl-undecaprenol N-acetylglucosamine transferase